VWVVNNRKFAKVLSAATLLVVVGLASACSSKTKTETVAASQGSSASSSSASSSSSSAASSSASSSSVATNDPLAGLQPLFPFARQADADEWAAAYRSGGQQPWHLDPDATALSFTNGFLGFTELDTVVSSTVNGAQAHVAVGFVTPNGDKSTAAVIHLVRFGTASDAPWEVVGTDDSASFTFENPSYGSPVDASFEAGGHITGVDENIVVHVHQLSSQGIVRRDRRARGARRCGG